MPEQLKQYNFKLPENLLNALKAKAEEEETNVTALILRGVKQILGLSEIPQVNRIDSELYQKIDRLEKRLAQVENNGINSDIYNRIYLLEEQLQQLRGTISDRTSNSLQPAQENDATVLTSNEPKGLLDSWVADDEDIVDEPDEILYDFLEPESIPANTQLPLIEANPTSKEPAASPQRIGPISQRKMEELTGISKITLQKIPLNTPTEAKINGMSYRIMCIERPGERKPSQWIAESV